MRIEPTVLVLLTLLVSGHVMSFSIGRRTARSTDLAQALSILQRQRRRIVGDDFFSSERLLEDRPPFDLEDISDWLSRARDEDDAEGLDTVWMSDRGNFRDFDQRERLNYDLSPLSSDQDITDQNEDTTPYEVEPSQKELENIFDTDADSNPNPQPPAVTPEKKKKEEMVDVRGDKKIVQKKSISDPVVADTSSQSSDDISLDTLTKEEFRALMKAVEKLQKQAAKLSEETSAQSSSTPSKVAVKETIFKEESPDGNTVEEVAELVPAPEDELNSVFADTNAPVVEETKVVELEQQGGPQGTVTETVETDLVPLLTQPETEEEERELEEALVNGLENGIEEDEEEAAAVEAVRRRLQEEEEVEEEEEEEEEEQENAQLGGMERLDPKQLAALENYWLMSSYLDKTGTPIKRTAKRAALISDPFYGNNDIVDDTAEDVVQNDDEDSSSDVLDELRAGSVPSVKAFVVRILELQNELDKLRTVTRLEDLENDELTDALNEATLAQNEGSVSDLEFDALQKAIRIEEALQEMKKGEKKSSLETSIIKRGEPWKRKRGPEVGLSDDTSSVAVVPPVYPVSVVKNGGVSKSDIERLLGESYLLQQAEDLEDTDATEDMGDIEDIGEQREVSSLFLKNADQCPAVREYSTNCELADLYSLPVDYEARALCNLHEMCYACGQSLSIPQEHCDRVYRVAASALCRDQKTCVVESEIFLRTMKLKTRYVPHAQPSCRSTCTARFLGVL